MSPPPSPKQKPFARFRDDWRKYSLQVAALHALRRVRRLAMVTACRELAALPAFRRHLAFIGHSDPLFLLAHRHYLAVGLRPRQRLDAALTHYRHEQRFGPDYLDQVYLRGGMVLWRAEAGGRRYDIRLMPGNDVLYEGGLSLVFHVDDGRVCVMSFSVVPRRLVLPGTGQGPVIFVTRKQLAHDHGYQHDFNTAFDRTTPGHMCFAALSGWALSLGFDLVVGIAAERHPSFTPAYAAQFRASYSDFWQSLSGQPQSPLGYVVSLPSQLTPIDELDPRRRKRALARRMHLQAVQGSAQAVMGSLGVVRN